jgi:hypothetical protein
MSEQISEEQEGRVSSFAGLNEQKPTPQQLKTLEYVFVLNLVLATVIVALLITMYACMFFLGQSVGIFTQVMAWFILVPPVLQIVNYLQIKKNLTNI